jgi:4-hydroxybenzoate polyprenyltransferase
LGWLGAITMALQAVLAVLVSPWMLVTLAILWGWWALMAMEFFAKAWLKAHPVVYLLSHMVSTPLLALHVCALVWLRGPASTPPPSLFALLAMSFCVGLVVELGRKTWSADRERPGVETYTSLWGIPRAATAWMTASLLACGAAVWAATSAHTVWLEAPVAAVAAALCMATGIVFISRCTRPLSKGIEAASAALAFLLFVGLGLIPRFWRPV